MGLSTTLFVMAFLLFGKHLWLCKVLESFHCLLMSLTTANPGLKLGGFYSLSIQCYTLPHFLKKRKKKDFCGEEGHIMIENRYLSQLLAVLAWSPIPSVHPSPLPSHEVGSTGLSRGTQRARGRSLPWHPGGLTLLVHIYPFLVFFVPISGINRLLGNS